MNAVSHHFQKDEMALIPFHLFANSQHTQHTPKLTDFTIMIEPPLVSDDEDDDDDGDAAYDGISPDGVFMLKWKEKHRLTNSAWLPPDWINEPIPQWGSRFRSLKHCDILYDSFMKAGT